MATKAIIYRKESVIGENCYHVSMVGEDEKETSMATFCFTKDNEKEVLEKAMEVAFKIELWGGYYKCETIYKTAVPAARIREVLGHQN